MNAHFPSHGRALLLAGLACLVMLPAGRLQGQGSQTVKYHGIRPSDPGGRQGLRNPERGWRIETVIAEPHQKVFIGPATHLKGQVPPVYQDDWWMPDARRYEPFGLTLVQTYCYLSECPDRPILAEKLDLLQRSLDLLRRHGSRRSCGSLTRKT